MPMNKYGEIIRNSSPPPILPPENNNNKGKGRSFAVVICIIILVVIIALTVILIENRASDRNTSTNTISEYMSEDSTSNNPQDVNDLSETEILKRESSTERIVTDEERYSMNNGKAFYGIWCNASKSLDAAYDYATNLDNEGWDCYIFLSSEWSNLNQENWYVVSIGIYSSKEDALQHLEDVRNIRSDAYIKYSGEYQGN